MVRRTGSRIQDSGFRDISSRLRIEDSERRRQTTACIAILLVLFLTPDSWLLNLLLPSNPKPSRGSRSLP